MTPTSPGLTCSLPLGLRSFLLPSAFELGNEQCGVFTAEETARNFALLTELLTGLYPNETERPKIIGPDPWGFHEPFGGHSNQSDGREQRQRLDAAQRLQFIVDFYRNCSQLGVHLHALSHHEYIDVPPNPQTPLNGNTTILDFTGAIASHVNRTLGAVAPGVQIWAGEVGPHNGGSPGCSSGGRWANWGNTFWYLDAMGSKARNGYSAFCRQDFIGIDYGMLDCKTQAPLPDYYGGVLWSMLMGRSVLSVTGAAPLAGRRIRAYAHCANTTPGAVTVLLLNTDAVAGAVVRLGNLGGSSAQRTEWHLTGPAGTSATLVALNGETLEYSVDPGGEAVLPNLAGRTVARVPGGDDMVEMAPASIVFVQVGGGDAANSLCK